MQLFPCLMGFAGLLALLPAVRADEIRFVPDHSPIACRAILPQCFTQQGWHRLCLTDPVIAQAHRPACAKAAAAEMDEPVD